MLWYLNKISGKMHLNQLQRHISKSICKFYLQLWRLCPIIQSKFRIEDYCKQWKKNALRSLRYIKLDESLLTTSLAHQFPYNQHCHRVKKKCPTGSRSNNDCILIDSLSQQSLQSVEIAFILSTKTIGEIEVKYLVAFSREKLKH